MRQDIQALRGLAIAVSLCFHAFPVVFPGGYLGVDVLFVISGYLMAQTIQAQEQFRYGAYLVARIRRLGLPLVPVLLVVALAGALLLTAAERASLWAQLAGAATFTANIVLWLQGGYFDQEASTKPLLHTWALAAVGQAAVLMPLVLRVGTGWRWLVAAMGLSSFIAFVLVLDRDASAAYFLLPFRLWEFAIGAAVFGLTAPAVPSGARQSAFALATVGLAILAAAVSGAANPAPMAAACALTAAVLWLAQPTQSLIAPLAWLGSISYALYLVHWPLLAFLRALFLGSDIPVLLVLAALAAALALAWPLDRLGARRYRDRGRVLQHTGLALAGAVLASAAIPQHARAATDWQHERRPNVGLSPHCDFDGPFEIRSECMTSDKPQLLIWGDSVAMQWVHGLARADAGNRGIAQATMSTCGPTLGVAPVYTGALGEAWARRCMAFNDAVLAWLQRQPQIRHVLLASIFSYHVESGQRLQTAAGLKPQTVDAALEALMRTVRAVRAAGKEVSVVAPLPAGTFDVGACLERRLSGLAVLGRNSCDIERKVYERTAASVLELLRRAQAGGVRVVWPSLLLCDERTCRVSIDGIPLYRDKAHLSYTGSEVLTDRLGLLDQVAPRR